MGMPAAKKAMSSKMRNVQRTFLQTGFITALPFLGDVALNIKYSGSPSPSGSSM